MSEPEDPEVRLEWIETLAKMRGHVMGELVLAVSDPAWGRGGKVPEAPRFRTQRATDLLPGMARTILAYQATNLALKLSLELLEVEIKRLRENLDAATGEPWVPN